MSVAIGGTSSTSTIVSLTGAIGSILGTMRSIGISTSANDSVVIGIGGAVNHTGVNNVFAGFEVAAISTIGNNNIALGYQAAKTIAGDGNIVIGSSAAPQMTSANGNVVVGVGASASLRGAYSNVHIGAGADATSANAAGSIAIGASSRASGGGGSAIVAAVALGRGATADGRYALALGTGVTASGNGAFSVANRLRGYVSSANAGSYVVQVDADALKLANGGMLAFTKRVLPSTTTSASLASPLDQAAVWRAGIEGDDLVFRSIGGSVVRFCDDYVSGVLDFVSTHHTEWDPAPAAAPRAEAVSANLRAGRHALAYLVVCSSGDAPPPHFGRSPGRNSAVPRVRLCSSEDDCHAAFGVVSPELRYDRASRRVGNLVFEQRLHLGDESGQGGAAPVAVHSQGQGWVWVRLAAGERVLNGDLLVACAGAGGAAGVSPDPREVTSRTICKASMTVDVGDAPEGGVHLVACSYRF